MLLKPWKTRCCASMWAKGCPSHHPSRCRCHPDDVNLATVDARSSLASMSARLNALGTGRCRGVEIKYYNVIYSAIDDVEAAMKGMCSEADLQRGAPGRRENPSGLPFRQVQQHHQVRFVRNGTIKRGDKSSLVATNSSCKTTWRIAHRFAARRTMSLRSARGYECGHLGLQGHPRRRHHRDLGNARKAA